MICPMELNGKLHISHGFISNILKLKHEYVNDYECNYNKKLKQIKIFRNKNYSRFLKPV